MNTCTTTEAAATVTPRFSVVEFTYDDPDAIQVFLAGSFNSWLCEHDIEPYRLGYAGNGLWKLKIPLAPGRYEYLFHVDGSWVPDPAAIDYVPNPFGGMNSVISVPDVPSGEMDGEAEA